MPLGLEVLRDGQILVCDTRRGLLRLDPGTGTIRTLVDQFDGQRLRFCSNATAARDETVWFTESTNRFDFEDYLGALLEHRPSGRLFRRTADGTVTLVLDGLYFPNGVTLTEDEDALLFVETDGYTLSRIPLTGRDAGKREILASNLPGFPDNLSRVRNGRIWVALPAARSPALDTAGRLPGWARKLVWRAAPAPPAALPGTVWAMAFSPDGSVVADLQATRPDFSGATGVVQVGEKLYLSSATRPGLLELDLSPP